MMRRRPGYSWCYPSNGGAPYEIPNEVQAAGSAPAAVPLPSRPNRRRVTRHILRGNSRVPYETELDETDLAEDGSNRLSEVETLGSRRGGSAVPDDSDLEGLLTTIANRRDALSLRDDGGRRHLRDPATSAPVWQRVSTPENLAFRDRVVSVADEVPSFEVEVPVPSGAEEVVPERQETAAPVKTPDPRTRLIEALQSSSEEAERLAAEMPELAAALRRVREFVEPLRRVLEGAPSSYRTTLGDDIDIPDTARWAETFALVVLDDLCRYGADAAREQRSAEPGPSLVRTFLKSLRKSFLTLLARQADVELVLVLDPGPVDTRVMKVIGRVPGRGDQVQAQLSCGLVVSQKVVRPADVLVG